MWGEPVAFVISDLGLDFPGFSDFARIVKDGKAAYSVCRIAMTQSRVHGFLLCSTRSIFSPLSSYRIPVDCRAIHSDTYVRSKLDDLISRSTHDKRVFEAGRGIVADVIVCSDTLRSPRLDQRSSFERKSQNEACWCHF